MLKIYYLLLKHYEGDLEGEKRWLLISQSIFAFSFFLRSVLIVLVLNNHWVAFVRDYPGQGQLSGWILLPLQFIIIDILPYSVLASAHWFNSAKRLEQAYLKSESASTQNEGGSQLDQIWSETGSLQAEKHQMMASSPLMVKYV